MSIVNEKEKYIFIHNPKAAGTSIEFVVGGSSHETIYGYWQQGIELYKYYKFMFVRNPYTRLISTFNQAKRGPTIFINKQVSNYYSLSIFKSILKDGFNEFINCLPCFFNFELKNYEEKMFPQIGIIIDHVAPQHLFSNVGDSFFLDFVGKVENINEDWKIVRQKLNIATGLPHMNAGQPSDIEDYFKERKTIDMVNELYKKDFELFNYKML